MGRSENGAKPEIRRGPCATIRTLSFPKHLVNSPKVVGRSAFVRGEEEVSSERVPLERGKQGIWRLSQERSPREPAHLG